MSLFTPSPTDTPTVSVQVLQEKLEHEWSQRQVAISLQKETKQLNAGFELEEQQQEAADFKRSNPRHNDISQSDIMSLISGTSESQETKESPTFAPTGAPTWAAADANSLLNSATEHGSRGFFDMIARTSMSGQRAKQKTISSDALSKMNIPHQDEKVEVDFTGGEE